MIDPNNPRSLIHWMHSPTDYGIGLAMITTVNTCMETNASLTKLNHTRYPGGPWSTHTQFVALCNYGDRHGFQA
jgi:hypothetical protein